MSGFEVKFGAEIPRPNGVDAGTGRYVDEAVFWPSISERGSGDSASLHLANHTQRILVAVLCGGVAALVAGILLFASGPNVASSPIPWLFVGIFGFVGLTSATSSTTAVIDANCVRVRQVHFLLHRREKAFRKDELLGLRHSIEVQSSRPGTQPRTRHFIVAESTDGRSLPIAADLSPESVKRVLDFAAHIRLCGPLAPLHGIATGGGFGDGGDGGGDGGDGGDGD